MEFELKVDGNPADAMYPLIYPFGNHVQAREPYPQPTGEWKNDRLLFESQPPKGVERFQIALSGKPEKLIYQERNIRFLWGGNSRPTPSGLSTGRHAEPGNFCQIWIANPHSSSIIKEGLSPEAKALRMPFKFSEIQTEQDSGHCRNSTSGTKRK